jgi:hypothetical protein
VQKSAQKTQSGAGAHCDFAIESIPTEQSARLSLVIVDGPDIPGVSMMLILYLL